MILSRRDIYNLPKIDLHRHLDGDVRSDTLLYLAKKEGRTLPARDKNGLDNYFKDLKAQGFASLLQKGFGLVTSLMQTEENLRTVAYESVRNLAEDNIIYGELRFAPQYHTGESAYYGHSVSKLKRPLTYEGAIRAVASGLKKGEKDFGVKTGLIVCIGREATEDTGKKVARAAIDCYQDGVVALDLACDEATYPPERHLSAYQSTFGSKLKRTVHAGEFGDQRAQNILTAITELRANRIGHALPLVKYGQLIQKITHSHIGVELCPESNIFCGLISSRRELGLDWLLRCDVLASINSDDPMMFGYTLTDTIYRLAEEYGLQPKHLNKLSLNAANSVFRDDVKKSLIDFLDK